MVDQCVGQWEMTVHTGKIRIRQALTPIHLFTIMENTSYVIQGLTLLTESLVLPNIISRYLPVNIVNIVTISRTTLLFQYWTSEILRECLRSYWGSVDNVTETYYCVF